MLMCTKTPPLLKCFIYDILSLVGATKEKNIHTCRAYPSSLVCPCQSPQLVTRSKILPILPRGAPCNFIDKLKIAQQGLFSLLYGPLHPYCNSLPGRQHQEQIPEDLDAL